MDEPDLFSDDKSVYDDERFRDAIRRKSALRDFENTDAWQYIVAYMKEVEESCVRNLTTKDGPVYQDPMQDYVYLERERIKLQMVRIFINTPAMLLEGAEEVVQMFKRYENGEGKEET